MAFLYNNIFKSKCFLALGIKVHAITAAGIATKTVHIMQEKWNSFPKNILANILAM